MLNKKIRIFALMFLFVLTSVFAIGEEMEYDNPSIPINIKNGQEFVIKLGSNHTAGFRWILDESSDANNVKFLGTEYKHDAVRVLGGGSSELWKFKAIDSGNAVLKFNYIVSTSARMNPRDTKTFKVIIE